MAGFVVLCLAVFAVGFTLGAFMPRRKVALAVTGLALVACLDAVAWFFTEPGAEEESARVALLVLSGGLVALWVLALLLSALVRTREQTH